MARRRRHCRGEQARRRTSNGGYGERFSVPRVQGERGGRGEFTPVPSEAGQGLAQHAPWLAAMELVGVRRKRP